MLLERVVRQHENAMNRKDAMNCLQFWRNRGLRRGSRRLGASKHGNRLVTRCGQADLGG